MGPNPSKHSAKKRHQQSDRKPCHFLLIRFLGEAFMTFTNSLDWRTPKPQPRIRAAISMTTTRELLRQVSVENEELRQRIYELEEAVERTSGLCEVLDDGGGWTSSLQTRASWLLGLLVCQSFSSFILADNEQLLVAHPTVIYFMTMLVGAGGNAGAARCQRE